MVHSMTGYGQETIDITSVSATVEIRTVNHRFLETSVYLPRPFMIYEEKVKQLAAQYIRRGKMDIYVTIAEDNVYERGLHVDWHLLQQYIEALSQARDDFSLSDDLRTTDLLQIPELFRVTDHGSVPSHVETALLDGIAGALRQVLAMRENEGEHLKADLVERLDILESSVHKLMDDAPKVVENYQSRLQEKVTSFLDGEAQLDEERLMNEVAVFSEKANIDEELTRFKSHLRQFRNYLVAEEAIGKKLNFLQQEMNREMNTIGAKANDADMSVEVVEAKNELESIKEQIQNIE